MLHNNFLRVSLVLLTLTCVFSCSDDPVVEPCDSFDATFDGDVQTIINTACAYSGCHDGTGTNTFIMEAANDFTSFAAMQSVINSGSFAQRTLVDLNMPPAAFVPAGSPTELTAEQIEILTCWRDAGYPEN